MRPEASLIMPARRFVQRACALLALGSIAMLSALGCVESEATFYVRNVGVFDESCVCAPGDTALSGGSFEASAGSDYTACLIVSNNLDSTEDRSKPRAETNHVEIYVVDVTLEGQGLTGGPDCPASFTFPSSGFAEPESLGTVIALAIPTCIAQQLGSSLGAGTTSTVVAKFVVHGHTTGGDEVETPEFSFPISVGSRAFCGAPPVEEGQDPPCRLGDAQVPSNLCAE
jgi:hypothetical protein